MVLDAGANSLDGAYPTESVPQRCPCAASECVIAELCPVSGWQMMAVAPPEIALRSFATYSAMDRKMFVFGGQDGAGVVLDSAALYDAVTDAWRLLPTSGLSARTGATALWTGSEVLVWGGGDASRTSDYGDGARYNPATGQWSSITGTNAPSPRRSPHMVWTGTRMLLWSGVAYDGNAVDRQVVYSYNPTQDSWTSGSSAGEPPLDNLRESLVAWSGSRLYIYGGISGSTERDTLLEYRVASDDWRTLRDGPSDRSGAFGGWDGTSLVAWGGANDGNPLPDGQRWVPEPNNADGGQWLFLPFQLQARVTTPASGWSFRLPDNRFLFLGGTDGGGRVIKSSLVYDSNFNQWDSMGPWATLEEHIGGGAVWTGQEVLLWGGLPEAGKAPSARGERLSF